MGTKEEGPYEKLTYLGVLKQIGKQLIELAWLLFTACQWIIVFFISFLFIITLFNLLTGNVTIPKSNDEQLISPVGIILWCISALIFTGFAYYYFFKMRKQGVKTIRYRFCIMTVYTGIYLLFAYRIDLAEKIYILENLRYSETTVRLHDADTNELLLDGISCSGFNHTSDQILPLKSVTCMKSGEGWHYELIDIKPKEITVSAPGYQSKSVLIGTEEGEHTVSVYLEKETFNDPNLPMKP